MTIHANSNSLSIKTRTFFYDRNFREIPRETIKENSQALTINYSNSTNDWLTFHVSYYGAIAFGELTGSGNQSLEAKMNEYEEDIGKVGQAFFSLNIRNNGQLSLGRQRLDNSMLMTFESRALPNTFEAAVLEYSLSPQWHIYGLYTQQWSPRYADSFVPHRNLAGDYINNIQVASISYTGQYWHGEFAYGRSKNYMARQFFKLGRNIPFLESQLTLELLIQNFHRNGELYDRDIAGNCEGVRCELDATKWIIDSNWHFNQYSIGFSMARVTGDTAADIYWSAQSGSYTTDPTSRIRSDFLAPNSRIWQLEARYDFTKQDLPGLSLYSSYTHSDDVQSAKNSATPATGMEWERNLSLIYQFQSIKGLQIKWRNAVYRSHSSSGNTRDVGVFSAADENRIYIDFQRELF
jgi:hypothetical protein